VHLRLGSGWADGQHCRLAISSINGLRSQDIRKGSRELYRRQLAAADSSSLYTIVTNRLGVPAKVELDFGDHWYVSADRLVPGAIPWHVISAAGFQLSFTQAIPVGDAGLTTSCPMVWQRQCCSLSLQHRFVTLPSQPLMRQLCLPTSSL